jgi:hypothetical protein
MNLWSINGRTGIEMAKYEVRPSADECSSLLGYFAVSSSK